MVHVVFFAPKMELGGPNMAQNDAREGPRGGPGRAWGYRKAGFEARWPPKKKESNPADPF